MLDLEGASEWAFDSFVSYTSCIMFYFIHLRGTLLCEILYAMVVRHDLCFMIFYPCHVFGSYCFAFVSLL